MKRILAIYNDQGRASRAAGDLESAGTPIEVVRAAQPRREAAHVRLVGDMLLIESRATALSCALTDLTGRIYYTGQLTPLDGEAQLEVGELEGVRHVALVQGVLWVWVRLWQEHVSQQSVWISSDGDWPSQETPSFVRCRSL